MVTSEATSDNCPTWLFSLLSSKFFVPCEKHITIKKNESNIFCIESEESICQHCLSESSGNLMLQIRRYVYHDVIRVDDVGRLIDTSGIQNYIINGAKAVFLNQRPQPRPTKGNNLCKSCDRNLQDDFEYCSLCCKVDYFISSGSDLKAILRKCQSLPAIEIRASSPTVKRTANGDCSPSNSSGTYCDGSPFPSREGLLPFFPVKRARTKSIMISSISISEGSSEETPVDSSSILSAMEAYSEETAIGSSQRREQICAVEIAAN